MGRSRNRGRNKGNGNGNGGNHGNPNRSSVTVAVTDTYQLEAVAQYFNHLAVETEGRYKWEVDREHLRVVVPADWITNHTKKEIAKLGGSLADR